MRDDFFNVTGPLSSNKNVTRCNDLNMIEDFKNCNIPNPADQLKERGLIAEVEYNLEDTIKRLENLEIGLEKLYCRIFDVAVGDTEKDMSKPIPIYSPNMRIRDKFNGIDGLLYSIDKIVEDLD